MGKNTSAVEYGALYAAEPGTVQEFIPNEEIRRIVFWDRVSSFGRFGLGHRFGRRGYGSPALRVGSGGLGAAT